MRVLQAGILPEAKPQKASCGYCQALIEFTAAEVRRVPDQRDGDFYSFPCPCCSREVTKAVERGYFGPG